MDSLDLYFLSLFFLALSLSIIIIEWKIQTGKYKEEKEVKRKEEEEKVF